MFGVVARANSASDYWKTYFSDTELKAVQKNAEKYTLAQIKNKSEQWHNILTGFNIKNGSITDDNIKKNEIATNKIKGLGDFIDEKISGNSTPQDFSADKLTGSYAALDGSLITNLNPVNISAGTLPALNGSQITGITASQVGAVPYAGATGAVDLNGNNLVNLGNVGIGTASPEGLLHIGATIGLEMVSNGDFSSNLNGWAGTNWTWSSGKALHTSGSTEDLVQSGTAAVVGETYKVVYTIVGGGQGYVEVYFGGAWGQTESIAGTYTAYLTATATDSLIFRPITADFNGAIDNVSITKLTSAGSFIVESPTEFRKALTVDNGKINVSDGSTISIGYQALPNSTKGTYNQSSQNIAIGSQSGFNTTTGHVTAVGWHAGYSNTDGVLTAFGKNAGYSNTTGHATFFGNYAGAHNTTSQSTCVGDEACSANSTGNTTAIGYYAGNGNTTGFTTALGYEAGLANTTGVITAVGYQAAYKTNTTVGVTAIGHTAGYNNTSGLITAIGDHALYTNTTGTAVGVGGNSGLNNTTGSLTAIGYQAGYMNTTANATTIGFQAGYGNIAEPIVAVGWQAGYTGSTAGGLTAIGYRASELTTSAGNTAVGYTAGLVNTTGVITAVGYQALAHNLTSNATAVGYSSLRANTTGIATALGEYSGLANTTGQLTAIGTYAAFYNTTGSLITIGYHSGYGSVPTNAPVTDTAGILIGDNTNRSVVSTTALTNYVGIGDGVLIDKSNQVKLGNASITETLLNGNVGIGTTTPVATLDINGTAKLKKYSSQPFACDATHDGTTALTSGYRTCVCKGTSTTWVFTTDGTTTCTW